MGDHKMYNDEILNNKRLLGDQSADNFIKFVFSDPVKKLQLQQWLNGTLKDNELQWLKDSYPEFAFIIQADKLPSWANQRLMKAGTAFFVRHSDLIMSLLGLLSLPYCYNAANGAMVLYISELICKQTTKRLYDTALFVWDIMGPGAFDEGGIAYHQILKVRIMHAAVRYYTLQSGKWDDTWGLPVNQEDMAGTNLSFSLIVIRGLRLLGINISQPDQEAFMHIWAVIGFLTGLEEGLIPENSKMAQHLDIAIKRRQFCASLHGKQLTRSLTDHILAVNKSKATAADILGLMRYLLGNEISNMLSIDVPELPDYKIKLIRTLNFLKSFKPPGNINQKYRIDYAAFKKQNPELRKRI